MLVSIPNSLLSRLPQCPITADETLTFLKAVATARSVIREGRQFRTLYGDDPRDYRQPNHQAIEEFYVQAACKSFLMRATTRSSAGPASFAASDRRSNSAYTRMRTNLALPSASTPTLKDAPVAAARGDDPTRMPATVNLPITDNLSVTSTLAKDAWHKVD
jgi:hypothetical protein